MTEMKRKLVVVEDEPLMNGLLAETLSGSGFNVETAFDAAQARKVIKRFDPDILLLDISLGDGPTGVHLAHAISRTRPDIAILILTKHPDARSATAEGLDLPDGVGFLRKHQVNDSSYLLNAINKVLADRANEVRQDVSKEKPFAELNDKQFRVLKLVAEGFNNAEIASRLDLSSKSVERLIDQIYQTLEIQTKGSLNPRVEAARRYFIEVGISERLA